ncbi:MAG: addiction module killer protein [Bacteroidales bacterium]|nr:addiction module killer protein [Bacteroidales bacterium]MBD5205864.1 addiction module killer protein [Bacteroidales bacterium]MBD5224316.1 addiction module killer protein [Bacteroidales bacterium]MBD5302873.1 addiction module killer protein [Bacteroides sp.]
MEVRFDKQYLKDLYIYGEAGKKHRFQPQIVKRYIRVIDLMMELPNVMAMTQYNSLRYEKLSGDKAGLSSVRVNDQYRIEFEEIVKDLEIVASICNITDLSNHYK